MLAEVDGRFEDRLAATPEGVASATDRAVARWTITARGLAADVLHVSDAHHPGPLAWLDGASKLAWGATVLDGTAPAWPLDPLVAEALKDVGAGGPRVFELVAGAVAGDARHVVLVLERPRSRRLASEAKERGAPSVRVAIVDASTGELVEIVEHVDGVPTALAWGDSPLTFGVVGRVLVRGEEPMRIGDGTAARALATSNDGTLAAGSARGRIYTRELEWDAHDGPVAALAWRPDESGLARLASGGPDGLRVWSADGELVAGLDDGGGVEAIAWASDDQLVVKSGGPGGRIVLAVVAGPDH